MPARRTITDAQIARVRRLRRRPVRVIAALTGVSPASVWRILSRQFRRSNEQRVQVVEGRRYHTEPAEQVLEKPQRCGGCGGMVVILPCRLCRAKGEAVAEAKRDVCQRPKCASAGVVRNRSQLRCARCGAFIRSLTEAERANGR